MRNSFINKVTRVHKVLTVANSISLRSTILVVFLEFILVDRAEISHMSTPQNSSRLPGSYEEALNFDLLYSSFLLLFLSATFVIEFEIISYTK